MFMDELTIPSNCTVVKDGEKLRDLDNFTVWKLNDMGESKVLGKIEQITEFRLALSGFIIGKSPRTTIKLTLSSAIVEWSIGTPDDGYKPILWVKTEVGYWYNLLNPAENYKTTFSDLGEQLHLLEICSSVLDTDANLSYEQVLSHLTGINISEDKILKNRKFLVQHLKNLFTTFEHKPFIKHIANEKKLQEYLKKKKDTPLTKLRQERLEQEKKITSNQATSKIVPKVDIKKRKRNQ